MADVTRPAGMRGWILPAPEITDANEVGDHSQQGPIPAIPQGVGSPALTLRAHGTALDSTNVDLRLVTGGYPGRTAQSAGFRWKAAADAQFIGWDPLAVRGYEGVFVAADGGGTGYAHPHAVALRYDTGRHGRVVALLSRRVGSGYSTVAWFRGELLGTWSGPHNLGTGTIGAHAYPTLLELESGRLVGYYWVSTPTAGAYQVRAKKSDDGGATWTSYADFVLPRAVTLTGAPGKMRAAYANGEVVLILCSDKYAGGVSGETYCYGSGDDGQSFVAVSSSADIRWGWEAIPNPAGGFLVTWHELTGSDFTTFAQALGSAFQPITSDSASRVYATSATLTDVPDTAGATSACADDDGTLWVVAGYGAGTNDKSTLIAKSEDGGATWLSPGGVEADPSAARRLWRTQVYTAVRPDDFSLCMVQGRALLVSRWVGGGYDADSFGALVLGGYTDETMRATAPGDQGAEWPVDAWVGIDSPVSIPFWTTTTAGTPTVLVTTEGLQVGTLSAAGLAWTRALATTAQYLRVERSLRVITGGSSVAKRIAIGALLSDGVASQYGLEVWLSTTALTVRDTTTGFNQATVSVDTTVAPIEVRAEVNQAGEGRVLYRKPTTPGDPIRAWSTAWSGNLVQKTSSVAAAGQVAWGTTPGTASQVVWSCATHTVSDTLHALPSTAADLLPRRLSGYPVELRDQYAVSAVDGPGVEGDRWACSVAYRYGGRRIDPKHYPSPRHGWRSNGVPTAQVFEWPLWTGENTGVLRSSVGLHLEGINWRTGSLDGYRNGAWEQVIAIDTSASFSALRYGDTFRSDVVPLDAGATNAPRWFHHGELVGGTAVWADLPGTELPILRNTSGWFGVDSPLTSQIRVGGEVGDLIGYAPVGKLEIWATRFTAVAHGIGDFERFRLVVDDQQTVDGDLRIGVVVFGPLIVAEEHGWGAQLEYDAERTVLTEHEDGTRSAVVKGSVRRTLTVAWPDGVVTDQVSGSAGDFVNADYLGPTGAPALGARAELPGLLAGLLEDVQGAGRTLVYLPQIPLVDAGWTHKAGAIYGRIMSSISTEQVAGLEDVDAVVRVTQLSFSEEL